VDGLTGSGVTGALLVAVLLGLRHATDPDHLTAVATLVLSERDRSRSRAAALGLAWGTGHGTTLFGFGLPVVLAVPFLPGGIQGMAEVAVGAVIALLSLRLLVRWKRGYFHAHAHEHRGVRHAHPHVHEGDHGHERDGAHERDDGHGAHAHRHASARSLRGSFAMGLLHGVAGSAAAGLIVLAASPDTMTRVAALAVFAAGTAVSMAVVSAALGYAVARGPARRFEALVPAVGLAGFAFGVAYGLHAAGMAPGLAPFLG
jgi:ABC-type nickel/cobalt efflux system permease component RcnA